MHRIVETIVTLVWLLIQTSTASIWERAQSQAKISNSGLYILHVAVIVREMIKNTFLGFLSVCKCYKREDDGFKSTDPAAVSSNKAFLACSLHSVQVLLLLFKLY